MAHTEMTEAEHAAFLAEAEEFDDLEERLTADFHAGNIPPITDAMERIIVAWQVQYADGGEFGNLHIIVADQNLLDHHIHWCRDYVRDHPDQRHALDLEMLDALEAADWSERIWASLIVDWLEGQRLKFEPDRPG